jgi:hypothetical protein
MLVVGSAVAAWGPGSGPHDGELVAVNLGQVVGHHQQSPLEAHPDPASPGKRSTKPLSWSAEQRLDRLFALSIPLVAVV